MKNLTVEFETLRAGVGVLDVAIRYDANTGSFEYIVEENGLPVMIRPNELAGVLAIVQGHVVNKLSQRD
jgi:hypothetical protein